MKDKRGKQQRQGDPNATPDPRFPVSDCVSFAIKEPEIQAQHGQNK
jgi:hypothetical protein